MDIPRWRVELAAHLKRVWIGSDDIVYMCRMMGTMWCIHEGCARQLVRWRHEWRGKLSSLGAAQFCTARARQTRRKGVWWPGKRDLIWILFKWVSRVGTKKGPQTVRYIYHNIYNILVYSLKWFVIHEFWRAGYIAISSKKPAYIRQDRWDLTIHKFDEHAIRRETRARGLYIDHALL